MMFISGWLRARKAFFIVVPSLTFILAGLAQAQSGSGSACSASDVPAGATDVRFSKRVINLCPKLAGISPDGSGRFPLFSGQWYLKPPSRDHYAMSGDVLAMQQGGDLVTFPNQPGGVGTLPLLPGKDGFYVEFDVRLSSDDADHWPAVWLMPAEHNRAQDDHLAEDPEHYERWLEIDVDEGGFGPGHHGAAISWWGIWPHYSKIQNRNSVSKEALDRTRYHTFAASYNPERQEVIWWVDNVRQMTATSPAVPKIAAAHQYYIIFGAQSHGKLVPYTMYVRRIRAFVPEKSALPPV